MMWHDLCSARPTLVLHEGQPTPERLMRNGQECMWVLVMASMSTWSGNWERMGQTLQNICHDHSLSEVLHTSVCAYVCASTFRSVCISVHICMYACFCPRVRVYVCVES